MLDVNLVVNVKKFMISSVLDWRDMSKACVKGGISCTICLEHGAACSAAALPKRARQRDVIRQTP